MFTEECFTYIFFARWENESSLDGFFVTLWQFMTLEISSLTSCIFPVGVSFRNLLWLNSVFGDAISVVYPYTYMAKCAITGLAVMVHGCATNQSFWRDHSFCYFLLAEFTRRTFFLQLKRLVTELRNFVESWNNGDCWYCCCRRWSNGDCWCCSWLQLFLLKHLSNVLGVLSSSIWVDFT